MGFDLNALAAKNAHVSVTYMGQTASVLYNPSLLTQENLTKAQTTDENFVDFFTDLVKDWDVKRTNRKVTINKKGLEGIPLPFLKAIFLAIVRDTKGDEDEGKDFSVGSRPKASSKKRRTGTASSS